MRDITCTCATESPAASEVREAQIMQYNAVNWELTNLQLNKVCKSSPLRCVKCRLVNKTQYIQHLTLGDSCGLPEVREVQISQ